MQSSIVAAQAPGSGGVGNPPMTPTPAQQPPAPRTQRTLLSSQFTAAANDRPGSGGAGNTAASLIANPVTGLLALSTAPVYLGRNMFVAADRLKDMIVPDALANAIALPSLPWGGVGGDGKKGKKAGDVEGEKGEKARESLDELLASSCPLCESVVVGLDKPFIEPEEVDAWQL